MHKLIITISTILGLATSVGLANHCHPEHAAKPAGNAPAAEKQVYGHYLLIQSALADDSIKGVPEAAAAIAKLARSESKLPAVVAEQAEKVGQANDLTAARAAFKELSDTLIAHRKADKALAEQFYVVHCSMAFDNQGASWLQATKTVSNPYYGASMLRCGVIKN